MIFYELNILESRFNELEFYEFMPSGKRILGDFTDCPHCGTHIGIKNWLPPYKIKILNKKSSDLICGTGRSFLVSTRFIMVWERRNLKGLEILDNVTVMNKGKKKSEVEKNYVHVEPHTIITRMVENDENFKIHKVVGCDICMVSVRSLVKGFEVDESSWNGDDIFYPSGLYGALLVTETVASFIKEFSFTNFNLVHQNSYFEEWNR